MDFVVLEMKGAPMKHKEHMVLLGKPFMGTTKTMIDVQSGKLTMTVFGETVQLKVQLKATYSRNQCSYVEYVYICLCLIFL